jgi:pteridine reductase
MQNDNKTKVALITGSGKRRVGNAVAAALAERGFSIALHYNRSGDEARASVEELRQNGVDAEAFEADVSEEADVEWMFEQLRERFGRLDVLVTAAAVFSPKPLENVTAEDVRRQFEVNTLGTFLCCRRAGLIMAEQPEGGSIVTMGDWATQRPYPDYSAYFVSKGAIPTLTRTLAVELSRRNPAVRVNCILPGPVMLPENIDSQETKGAIDGTLVKRIGSPQNVAQAVISLIENDFITGVCLPVDGGRTLG